MLANERARAPSATNTASNIALDRVIFVRKSIHHAGKYNDQAIMGEIGISHSQGVSELRADRVEIPLKELIVQRIQAENPRTVRDLFQVVAKRRPMLSEEDFANTVREMKDAGTLDLESPAPKVASYTAYLKVQDENAWFYAVVLTALATVTTIYGLPSTYPLVMLRWATGSIFVLFLPGYVTIQALFPEGKELDNIERFALTVGLSLAITPLLGLILNYTPWGIRLDPIVVTLSLFTLGVGVVGTFRRYRLVLNRLSGDR